MKPFNKEKDKEKKGKDPNKVEQSKPVKKKLFNLTFRENRKREIKVGREMLTFLSGQVNPVHPKKYGKGVPEEIINHPDFKIVESEFNVTKK